MVAILKDTTGECTSRVLDSRPAGQVCDVERVQRVLVPRSQLGVVEVGRPAEALAARVVAEQLPSPGGGVTAGRVLHTVMIQVGRRRR